MWEISNELKNLYDIATDYLMTKGFTRIVYNAEAPDYKYSHSSYEYDKDLEHTTGNFKGIGICVDRIYHSNGAKRDTSYRIDICEWSGAMVHTLDRIKITVRDSEKVIKKKLDYILDKYNEIKRS